MDIRKWIEGKYEEEIELSIPEDLPFGEYEVQIGIGGNNEPCVVFATDAKQDGDFFVLAYIEIR